MTWFCFLFDLLDLLVWYTFQGLSIYILMREKHLSRCFNLVAEDAGFLFQMATDVIHCFWLYYKMSTNGPIKSLTPLKRLISPKFMANWCIRGTVRLTLELIGSPGARLGLFRLLTPLVGRVV